MSTQPEADDDEPAIDHEGADGEATTELGASVEDLLSGDEN